MFGFKSVRVVIFSQTFVSTSISSLVRCHIFLYFIRSEDNGGGLCEEVPKIPSPPPRWRMCLLPGMMDKMDRSMTPDLQIDIVRCEAYETCMPIKSGDTSNIGGFGLG